MRRKIPLILPALFASFLFACSQEQQTQRDPVYGPPRIQFSQGLGAENFRPATGLEGLQLDNNGMVTGPGGGSIQLPPGWHGFKAQ